MYVYPLPLSHKENDLRSKWWWCLLGMYCIARPLPPQHIKLSSILTFFLGTWCHWNAELILHKIQDTRHKNFISDKKNITKIYNCKAKFLLSQENGLKPVWFELSKLSSSRKSIIELKSGFSKIFLKIGQGETGL